MCSVESSPINGNFFFPNLDRQIQCIFSVDVIIVKKLPLAGSKNRIQISNHTLIRYAYIF